MKEVESVVIRFSGDSGDGMQLTGTQFSNTSALMGNDIATFPDFPAEIRAPIGTVAGVSGFQVNIGAVHINTPGDEPDVLVAMNPAALKANVGSLKKGGAIIVNIDSFDERNLEKAGYAGNPLDTHELDSFQIIKANITNQTMEALKGLADLDSKSKGRCKNFYALGMTYFMFHRDLEPTKKFIAQQFAKKPILIEANVLALQAGWNYAETIEAQISTYSVHAATIEPGTYRQINGNTATAWGFIQASMASGRPLFQGTYPITPASDILHELSKYKHFGVKTFQAEDEIAACASAIGAAFGGALAITTSSGPGIALKGEAIGLAMMYELPLVVVDVQRGGPSTGLPTKTEQSDLNMALNGRNGECPIIVVAASKPNDCFHMAYEASRLALEHMTPVMLLTDGYIANGSEPWQIPDLAKYSKINTRLVDGKKPADEKYLPYKRDEKNLARTWAIPGTPGYEHRVGGLEKAENSGNVSYDPTNHAKMVKIRQDKINRVADFIPEQRMVGEKTGDLLVISWGGTFGATYSAVNEVRKQGKKVSLAHITYINPMPKNLGEIIKGFKEVLVCELNNGQMRDVITARYECHPQSFTKVEGLPFKISELVAVINKELENLKKQ